MQQSPTDAQSSGKQQPFAAVQPFTYRHIPYNMRRVIEQGKEGKEDSTDLREPFKYPQGHEGNGTPAGGQRGQKGQDGGNEDATSQEPLGTQELG